MLDKATIQKLKQSNISTDAEKTKSRFEELWRKASNDDKNAVEKLAGVARATIYRIYKTGSISAKLVVPIAQIFNVNPFYLTGESDEAGEFDEKLLDEFLTAYDYKSLTNTLAKVSRQRRKTASKAAPPEIYAEIEALEAVHEEPLKVIAPEQPAKDIKKIIMKENNVIVSEIEDMNEQEMSVLLQAAMIRRKYGEKDSFEHIAKLKKLLLSLGTEL